MNSTDNINNAKIGKEIDVRDATSYLLSKLWIIALITALSIVAAFLITSFTTELYTSTNKVMLINKNEQVEGSTSDKLNPSDLSIAIQLTKMSSEIFTSDSFANRVSEMLNEDTGKFSTIMDLVNDNYKTNYTSFSEFYYGLSGDYKILFKTIKSSLSVKYNEDTCAVTLSSTTKNKYLSAFIVTAAYECMQEHINENFKVDSIIVGQVDYGKIPSEPSNIHYSRNMIVGAVLGAVAICALLLSFYVFDDKIKTPDDIEKHLGLSVLGEIPEIEDEA